jgi:hypothetical protein
MMVKPFLISLRQSGKDFFIFMGLAQIPGCPLVHINHPHLLKTTV